MQEFLNNIIPNVMAKLPDFYAAIDDTLLMVVWSGAISFVLGLALGVLITVTKPGGILENKIVYQILDKLVSLFRSIPFIILLTWVMPVSRAIMGTAIYVRGAIVPLVFGAVPFFTRQVESALAELPLLSAKTKSAPHCTILVSPSGERMYPTIAPVISPRASIPLMIPLPRF